MGRIEAVCLSEEKGVPKTPRAGGTLVAEHGFQGDAHAGGWHCQVSLLALENIDEFRRRGADVAYGDFGENLVVSGIDFDAMRVGDRLACGGAVLEITQFGKECHARCRIHHAMGDCIMPRRGVFARVVRGGRVGEGDVIDVVGVDHGDS